MSLIDMITAVFGKAKYNNGNVAIFSPEMKKEHTTMIEDAKDAGIVMGDTEYHWRDKDECIACSKHRVVMRVPQYHDFGHHKNVNICAKCAKEMYGMSRYLFNETAKQHEYLELDTWAKNNYVQLKGE